MKLTIKSNGKITAAAVKEIERNGFNCHCKTNETSGEIYAIEIDFTPPALWSDLEMWLEDENGKLCDYAKMNISKRNKMQFSK